MAWTINGSAPEALGLTVVSGEFRCGSASTVRLACGGDATGTELFAYDAAVTILWDAEVFFQGKARRIDKSASGSAEGMDFLIEDAWAELERTTYQEQWGFGSSGYIELPQVVLGVDEAGNRINVGQQITEVIYYAAESGVNIQAGTMPTGLDLWPTPATGMSCAEVVRTCLRYHPDWVPWIDHTQDPPMFNVSPRATAAVLGVALTDCTEVRVTRRNDRMPECVRLVFLTSKEIDGLVYRDASIDKFPVAGPDSGPGVLTTVIELAGGSCQISKQQIETRLLPIPGTSTRAEAKEWLRAHYPVLVGIDDTHFGITKFAASVVEDTNTKPDAVNPNAARLALRDMEDAPRELVEGSIQEWMRERVGKVQVKMTVKAGPLATAAEKALIEKIPPVTYVTGTTATTKIYKGMSQWTAAEEAPTGLAEAYYNVIRDGCEYEGSVSLLAPEGAPAGFHGACLNISGGVTAWASMKAPIHSVAWDMADDRMTVSFGPNPDLSVQDYVEYLRLLRNRTPGWMFEAERTSPTLGDTAGPSAKGEAIGPLAVPKETIVLGDDTKPPLWCEIVYDEAETEGDPGVPNWVVTRGRVFERQRAAVAGNMLYHEPDNILAGALPARFAAVTGEAIYVQVIEAVPGGTITSVTIVTGAQDLEATETSGVEAIFNYKLAECDEVSGELVITPFLTGSHIYHWPEGRGLNLKIQDWLVDTDGRVSITGSPRYLYWRKGGYVGKDDPGTGPDDYEDVANLITA